MLCLHMLAQTRRFWIMFNITMRYIEEKTHAHTHNCFELAIKLSNSICTAIPGSFK